MASSTPPTDTPEKQQLGGPDLRWVLVAVVVAAIAGGVVALATGKSGSKQGTTAKGVSGPSSSYAGSLASPPEPAPPLTLRNYKGERVDISSYRGEAVLLTFIYTHCPDVCPLIVGNLHTAQQQLGAQAAKAQILAVSVDSRGDTPKTVARFLAAHRMTGRMQYLIGSTPELAKVWKAWGVGSERDAKNPDLVEHSGLVYGISASGKITTLYAANFKPAEVVHDVPLLASS
jgi:protein SCO1/2